MKCIYKWNYFNTDDCLFTYEMVAKEDHMELVISRNNSVVATLPFSSLSSLQVWTDGIMHMAFGLNCELQGAPLEDFVVDDDEA